MKRTTLTVLAAPLLAFAAACVALTAVALPARADIDVRSQMLLGNPSGAGTTDRNNFLLQRPQLALSYDDALRFPRWVAWHLSARDIGTVERGQFQPDPLLRYPPAGLSFTLITPSDYSRSGYDRGHNCPSKDRSATRQDNDAVFFMSNMTPQQHGLNGGPWERLESYCRDLARQGNELYIYAGHGFSHAPLAGAKPKQTIGRDKIAVPDFAWKLVVVLPVRSGDDRKRINGATTRVIAVRMPNISTIARKDWREFRTSVADIETATGLRFFDALAPDVAKALKERVDFDRPAPSKVKAPRRTATPRPPAVSGAASNAPRVWVNTRSKVYWMPGTEFYGKTKQGKYMTEAEARKAGYRKAQDQ